MNYDAMIIIDMQTALINEHPFNERKVISNIQELISLCRMQNIPLIYIRHDGGTGDELEKGTEGWEIHKALAPSQEDCIIDKKYNSAFRQTALREYLENLNAKKIIMCGMQTEYCFDVSCKVAFEYGYEVTIPKDTTTTFDNDFTSGEKLARYYEEKIWNHRYANVLSIDEIRDTM